MIKEFIDYWYKDKHVLEEYFKTCENHVYLEYEDLVKLVFDRVINPNLSSKFSLSDMTVIDDGNYQGTQIFILHIDTYQPCVTEYIYTNTYYGSCSVCDTLQGIQAFSYAGDVPTEKQVQEYMLLCLHLLEKCHYMKDEEKE